jgi:class 3 adenylate cyclase
MPIFIDRLDMRDMTAESVAAAHRKDLEIQDKYGVKYMTYWFDHARGTGFCLVDAPDGRPPRGFTARAMVRFRRISSPSISTRSKHSWDASAIRRPPHAPRLRRWMAGLRAIMFTDIVGSTEMTARLGDAVALGLVRVHDALVLRGLAAYSGRAVKHTGDGIMAAFADLASAVKAAAEIQRHFSAYNRDAAESLSVRIGIHAGEPVADHDDLFGATVQLASRLCSEAEADGTPPRRPHDR